MSKQIEYPNKFRVIMNFVGNTLVLFNELDRADGSECYVAADRCYTYVKSVIYQEEFNAFRKELRELADYLCCFAREEVSKESVLKFFTDSMTNVDAWVYNENVKRKEMKAMLKPIFKKHYEQLVEDVLDVVVISE